MLLTFTENICIFSFVFLFSFSQNFWKLLRRRSSHCLNVLPSHASHSRRLLASAAPEQSVQEKRHMAVARSLVVNSLHDYLLFSHLDTNGNNADIVLGSLQVKDCLTRRAVACSLFCVTCLNSTKRDCWWSINKIGSCQVDE